MFILPRRADIVLWSWFKAVVFSYIFLFHLCTVSHCWLPWSHSTETWGINKEVVMVSNKKISKHLKSFNNLEYNTCSVAKFSLLAGLYLISVQLKVTDLSNFYQCNCLSVFCFYTHIDFEVMFRLIFVPGCTDFVSSVEQIELLANQMKTPLSHLKPLMYNISTKDNFVYHLHELTEKKKMFSCDADITVTL